MTFIVKETMSRSFGVVTEIMIDVWLFLLIFLGYFLFSLIILFLSISYTQVTSYNMLLNGHINILPFSK
jgi:hypothetical protein